MVIFIRDITTMKTRAKTDNLKKYAWVSEKSNKGN